MTTDAEQLLRWFHDNVWASIRYVHHQGFGAAAVELQDAGFIDVLDDCYVIKAKQRTDLPKLH